MLVLLTIGVLKIACAICGEVSALKHEKNELGGKSRKDFRANKLA